MNNKTKKLLRLCHEAGYKFVAIGVFDRRNKTCVNWPREFGYSSSIFCSPDRRINDWPAIWSITEQCGLKSLCGNSNQRQIADIHRLTRGAYRLPITVLDGSARPKQCGGGAQGDKL